MTFRNALFFPLMWAVVGCSETSGLKTVPAKEGARFVAVRAIADTSDLDVSYRVAKAPAQSGKIGGLLTIPDLDKMLTELLPSQYSIRFRYGPLLDGHTAKPKLPSQCAVMSWAAMVPHGQETYGGFESAWNPATRTLLDVSGSDSGNVGPAIVPLPAPLTISFVTGFDASPVRMTLRREGDVLPPLGPNQKEVYYCLEYEADASPSNGLARPRIWVEKNTGIVLGGFGDFANESGEVESISWILLTCPQFSIERACVSKKGVEDFVVFLGRGM